MKKKFLIVMLALIVAIVSAFALTACINLASHEHTFSAEWEHDETYHWHKAICGHASETKDRAEHSFNNAHKCTVCGYVTDKLVGTEVSITGFEEKDEGYYVKVPNSTDTFSFNGKVTVADGATWRLFTDIDCTKEVPSRTKALVPGDNNFYILVTRGDEVNCYSFIVRRKKIYTVTIVCSETHNGTAQQVEEDGFASEPTWERAGYALLCNFDFTKPIIGDMWIEASWDIINYKITYELNGGKASGNPATYTVEDSITLSNPQKDYYDFAGWSDGGRIEKGSIGDKVFTAEYTPTVYKITYDCGIGINAAENKKTYTIESETITLSDAYCINADFAGWKLDDETVTEISHGSHGDITLVAVWDMRDVTLELAEDGKSYIVTGKNPDKTDIVIKSAYKGIPVTAIKERAFENSDIVSVTIPDSVTSIGNYAFENCPIETAIIPTTAISSIPKTNLKTVILTSGTSIESYAFEYCYSLTSITIPDSVTKIGSGAFYNCYHLVEVYNLSSLKITKKAYNNGYVGYYALDVYTNKGKPSKLSKENDFIIHTDGNVKTVVGYFGVNTEITIPDGVTNVMEYAFCKCSDLTSITIPSSVTSIGDRAFYKCDGLKSITIPGSVTVIGVFTFYGCSSLETIYCEAESSPNGWTPGWKDNCSATVVWGYKGE